MRGPRVWPEDLQAKGLEIVDNAGHQGVFWANKGPSYLVGNRKVLQALEVVFRNVHGLYADACQAAIARCHVDFGNVRTLLQGPGHREFAAA